MITGDGGRPFNTSKQEKRGQDQEGPRSDVAA